MTQLSDKHRPETWDEIQGHNSDLEDIRAWADNWMSEGSGILLVGPPGIGKTTTAEVISNHLDVPLVEVNASTARTTEDIEEMASQVRTHGAEGPRVILLDEVDSWHHAARKQPLYDALDDPRNPVVATANDEYDVPSGLKRRLDTYEFNLGKRSRKARIRQVAEEEGIDLDSIDTKNLAKRPDLRSALNDLESYQSGGTVQPDAREWSDDEWSMMDRVLTGTPDLGDTSPPDAVMWLDETTSAVYRGLELSMAYEALSLADVQLGLAEGSNVGYGRWRHARSIVEQVAHIRISEPYYGDEIGYQDSSFPEWFRHSKTTARSDSPTPRLYRMMREAGRVRGCNYRLFAETHLPYLRDAPEEEIYSLILSLDIPPEVYEEALSVSESAYERWREAEEPEGGDGGRQQGADPTAW